ncbi:hypothetical protein B566_EDAN001171 [Ephemera danica]|nr:hypothetical protein B566_EDAN001171 [Ephemera danica]
MSHKELISVCQMTATNDKKENFKVCKELIELSAKRGAKMVFLPEACDFVGENTEETLALAEETDGSFVKEIQELAEQLNIWISLGGIHEKVCDQKIRNAHVIVSGTRGKTAAVYRKLHLFDVQLPEKRVFLQESKYVTAGTEIVDPVDTPVGKVGMGIVSFIDMEMMCKKSCCVCIVFSLIPLQCYDLRFPELSLALRDRGAEILTYPSAFTVATGPSHWEPLLKGRAIETQCYVVAAAQTGAHNKKRSSYGHAMVIDPWGTVIAQCSEGTGICLAEVDLAYVRRIREEMPIWSHRRTDVYPKFTLNSVLPNDDDMFQFGHCTIQGRTIFYKTNLTYAFTNKKCVVPGRTLFIYFTAICLKVKKMSDLTAQEVADLFQVTQKVQKVMEDIHQVSSSTIAVQDGPDAGQTVQHVHVHVLPRKPGDFFQNDEVYHRLQQHDKVEDPSPWRTEEEMAAEAQIIRGHFK